MAAVAEITSEVAVATKNNSDTSTNKNDNLDSETSPKSESKFTVQKLVDMFTKLNPLAKEFFPSSYNKSNSNQFHINNFPVPIKQSANDNFPKKRRNDFNQGRRRMNGRAYRAQREDSIRRTVYVSDIDQHVTEERLAGLFSGCGQQWIPPWHHVAVKLCILSDFLTWCLAFWLEDANRSLDQFYFFVSRDLTMCYDLISLWFEILKTRGCVDMNSSKIW